MLKKQLLLLAVFVLTLAPAFINAQEYDFEKSMKLAQPNENHKRLEEFTGPSNYTMTSSMGGVQMDGKGTVTGKMILGGRFLMQESVGTMFGQTVESITIMGYDNAIGKYTMIGLDELGTYYITAEGDYDEATKTYTLDGSYIEPVMKVEMDYRFVIDVANPDEVITKILFDNGQGGMDEMMRLVYTK